MNALSQAAQDVLAERERQRQKWGDTHDDEHTNDSLAYGAVDYLLPGQRPSKPSWAYKSKVVDRDPRRAQLVKGAALALATVEQFDRATTPRPTPTPQPEPDDYEDAHSEAIGLLMSQLDRERAAEESERTYGVAVGDHQPSSEHTPGGKP